MTAYGYLILIRTDVYHFLLSLNVEWEVIWYQTLKTVFDYISKYLKARQKYFASRRIHDSLPSSRCLKMLSNTLFRFWYITLRWIALASWHIKWLTISSTKIVRVRLVTSLTINCKSYPGPISPDDYLRGFSHYTRAAMMVSETNRVGVDSYLM